MKMIAFWGLTALISAALAGFLAASKNRDYSFWAAWCFIFPPLILVLVLMSRNPGPTPRQPTLDEEDRAQSS